MALKPTSNAGGGFAASMQAMVDNQNASRAAFDAADQKFNDSAGRILESFARLAEERPAEVFGLEPTAREKFLVREALRPAIDQLARADTGGDTIEDLGGGLEGGNPGLIAGLAGLADVLKSPQGPELLDKIFKHVEAEKNFIKDTGKEIIDGVGDLIGKGYDWVTGG